MHRNTFLGIVDKLLLEFEKAILPTERAGRDFVDRYLKKVLTFYFFLKNLKENFR